MNIRTHINFLFIVTVLLFFSSNLSAACPDGKIEVERITPSGRVQIICVSGNALGGVETAGENAAGSTTTASFKVLYDEETGEYFRATAISGDGNVIVGNGFIWRGFRYTRTTGFEPIAQQATYLVPHDLSYNGSVIVGYGAVDPSTPQTEAFRWTEADGIVSLGDLPGGYYASSANGVSADGDTVVGQGRSENGTEAFVWTVENGMVGIGDLPGGQFASVAYAVSGDGSVIVGFGYNENSQHEAFRWTAAEGMQGLGFLHDNLPLSEAKNISADGQVIVGRANTSYGQKAFRWTATDGMVRLQLILPGYIQHQFAFAASADGSVIVGHNFSPGTGPFRWKADEGVVPLQLLLQNYGVDTEGWYLLHALDVSDDGKTIIGNGYNEVTGQSGSWVVTLP